MWRDYIKGVQNLEKYAIGFFCWVEIQMIEPRDHVLRKWKIDK